jgi:hypothetical protein
MDSWKSPEERWIKKNSLLSFLASSQIWLSRLVSPLPHNLTKLEKKQRKKKKKNPGYSQVTCVTERRKQIYF